MIHSWHGLDVIQMAWAQLWQVTLVAIVVLAANRFIGRHRPHLAYVMLLLLVAKALTPPIVSSRLGVFSQNWLQWVACSTRSDVAIVDLGHGDDTSVPYEHTATLGGAQGQDAVPSSKDEHAVRSRRDNGMWDQDRTIPLVSGLWGVGVALAVARFTRAWWRWRRPVHRTCSRADDHLLAISDRIAGKLGLRRPIRILISSRPVLPFCFGVFRPTIILPGELATTGSSSDRSRLESILAHEMVHIRRWDPLVTYFQVLMVVAWWFHPILWFASRQMSRVRERCCDEETVASTACDPAHYAQAVVDALKLWPGKLADVVGNGISHLEATQARLEAIMRPTHAFCRRTPRFYWIFLVIGLYLVVPGTPSLVGPVVAEHDAPSSGSQSSPPETGKTLQFGEPLELVISEDAPGAASLVDLDQGKVFARPQDKASLKGRALLQWYDEQGIDAVGAGDMLLGVNLAIDHVGRSFAEIHWDNVHHELFAPVENAINVVLRPITADALNSTFMFRTRDGGRGVLQIAELIRTDDRSRVFKMGVRLWPVVEIDSTKVKSELVDETDIHLVRKEYDVRVHLGEDFELEDLVELIESCIDENEWENVGGRGTIKTEGDHRLVIEQTPAIHRRLTLLLDVLADMTVHAATKAPAGDKAPLQRTVYEFETQATRWALVVYDVADLVSSPDSDLPDYDSIIETIEDIQSSTWQVVGGTGKCQPYDAALALVILQTVDNHRQIQRFLSSLRQIRQP